MLKTTLKRNSSSRGIAIRHYVFGVLRKNGDTAVRLPSSYELAELFGTTRRVVRYELELLRKEKVVISKPRVGTFTNPQVVNISVTPVQKKMPMIGVIDNDGTRFCYGRAENRQMSHIGLALADRNCYLHPISFSTNKDESRVQELKRIGLDGVIWRLDSRLKMIPRVPELLAAEGIPSVVICSEEYPTLNQIHYITETAENKLIRHLENVSWDTRNAHAITLLHQKDRFTRNVLTKLKIPQEKVFPLGEGKNFSSTLSDFKKLLAEKGPPSLILCNVLYSEAVPYVLAEFGMEKIPFVASFEMNGLEEFPGYAVITNAKKIAEKAADLLLKLIRGKCDSPVQIGVESILTYRGKAI